MTEQEEKNIETKTVSEVVVRLKDGPVTIGKPKAGPRNRALIASETPDGVKQTAFLVEIMPYCIKAHPWGTRKLREVLDNLEIEEYDKLVDAFKSFDVDEETKKK